MPVLINIDDLARKIASHLRGDDLWSYSDVAAYLKVKPRTVSEHYALTPGFPKAIRLPNAEGARTGDPRFIAAEVKKWATSHQGGQRTGRPRGRQ